MAQIMQRRATEGAAWANACVSGRPYRSLMQRRHRRSAMPHRGRYTERPAPATDAARVGQDAIGSAPRHSSQASRAGCLLCDALESCPRLPNGTFRRPYGLRRIGFFAFGLFHDSSVPKVRSAWLFLNSCQAPAGYFVPRKKKTLSPPSMNGKLAFTERERGALAAERAD